MPDICSSVQPLRRHRECFVANRGGVVRGVWTFHQLWAMSDLHQLDYNDQQVWQAVSHGLHTHMDNTR